MNDFYENMDVRDLCGDPVVEPSLATPGLDVVAWVARKQIMALNDALTDRLILHAHKQHSRRGRIALTGHAEATRLMEALEWYADPLNYVVTQAREPRSAVQGDDGNRARAAIRLATGAT